MSKPLPRIVVETEHNPVLAAKQQAHIAQIIERYRHTQAPQQPTPKKAG